MLGEPACEHGLCCPSSILYLAVVCLFRGSSTLSTRQLVSRTQEVEHLQRLGKGEVETGGGEAETGGGRRRLEKGGVDWRGEAETL